MGRYDSSGYDGPPIIHPNYGPATAYTKEELANLQAHYAAEIYLVNKWIGYVLDKIEELGLFDNSVVIFTSDHGMFVGEHNRTGKSNIHPDDDRVWPLYEEISHIPLMIAAPEVVGGRRVSALTQSVDLLPTLMALAGVEKSDLAMHGHSLAPLLAGSTAWPRQYAFSSTFIRNGGPTVTDERWTYLAYGEHGGAPELYDMQVDPQQQTNVSGEHPEVARRMQQALADFLDEMETPEENRALLGPVGGPDYN